MTSLSTIGKWLALASLFEAAAGFASGGLSYNGLAQTPQMGWVRMNIA